MKRHINPKELLAFHIEAETRRILSNAYPIEYGLMKDSIIFPDDYDTYPTFTFSDFYPGLSPNLLMCCKELIEVTYEQVRGTIIEKKTCNTQSNR